MLNFDDFSKRRSARKYSDRIIPRETIDELLRCGLTAPTGSNQQPWGFVLIQDKAEIERLNLHTKQFVKDNLDSLPYLKQYSKWLDNPAISLFHHAANLLVVYGNPESHWFQYDCSMVAGYVMLAAAGQGIGSCWIGFAEHTLNRPSFKEQYRVPQGWELVCPMTLGYIEGEQKPAPSRKAPVIFNLD